MGEYVQLTARDDHKFDAYRAKPDTKIKGAVVVIQEIFGVNIHIREVADTFAQEGYLAIAPAIFDRFEKRVELGYESGDISIGKVLKAKGNKNLNNVIADVEAAFHAVQDTDFVGITGYCWGGVIAWAAACRLKFDAASSYYGGGIIDHVDEKPNCPTILHFGREDKTIPLEDVHKISMAHPELSTHLYDAGHGFNCDHRGSYDEGASKLAFDRTLELFAGVTK
jgi:carboxymethylenebutenolidase